MADDNSVESSHFAGLAGSGHHQDALQRIFQGAPGVETAQEALFGERKKAA